MKKRGIYATIELKFCRKGECAVIKNKHRKGEQITVPAVIRHFLLGWLLAVTVAYVALPPQLRALTDLQGLARMSFGGILLGTGVLGAVLCRLSCFWKIEKIERWAIAGAFSVLALLAWAATPTDGFLLFGALVLGILALYATWGWNKQEEEIRKPRKSHWGYAGATAVFTMGFFLFVSIWTVNRVKTFSTPSYDFGIFSQMFHYMKTTGLPLTTLERDGLLSHFAVHVSPIYYLMLPFYCLFPRPETLQVLQAAVLSSAVIPLWLIGKRRGLSGMERMLLCGVLLLLPAVAGGTSYDLHENCFLTPLILWLFYGIEKKNIPITALSAGLTLMVKEDAPVYVAVIGLYLLVKTALRGKKADRQALITGGGLLVASLVWFFAATGYLAQRGDGVMTYRYSNFMFDGTDSLFTVIKAVIMNPMKALFECVDKEKLQFIGWTFLPLLGLPLLTRRYERYLLLIPYMLVNLMSDYQYQHDIFFQYTFGANAFLIYLTAVNLADLKGNKIRFAALYLAVLVSGSCFATTVVPKAATYSQNKVTYEDYYENIRNTLDTIPDGASVASTTFYTTYLSQRDILYDIRYCTKGHLLETEYVVLKVSSPGDYKKYATGGQDNGYENLVKLLEENGYTRHSNYGEILVIYRKVK